MLRPFCQRVEEPEYDDSTAAPLPLALEHTGLPRPFQPFAVKRVATAMSQVREEIAECSEKAYSSIGAREQSVKRVA